MQVQAELRDHADPSERWSFVTHELMGLVCELLHDPTELLHEIARRLPCLTDGLVPCRWASHPMLQKQEIEAAKQEQMDLMQAQKLMCAASRKRDDRYQKQSEQPDGRPLCPFCAQTFDGSAHGCACTAVCV